MIAALICMVQLAGAAAAEPDSQARRAQVARLPLEEIPATAAPSPTMAGRLALVLSGDGGWSSLDRSIAANFAQRGIPVVGLNSLRYFWNERQPAEAASDVNLVIEHYLAQWHLQRVDLVGFSFGADVLPFIVNRLPADTAARIATTTLIGPSPSATFEIHVSNWLPGITTHGLSLAPEIGKLKPVPLCLYGSGEAHDICGSLPATQVDEIGSGHHLGGEGELIVARILR
jgi:type IV secretory pathway VirJ component